MEKTFIIIKPDAVERKLAGKIISMLEQCGLGIICAKKITISRGQAEEHYSHIKGLSFYNDMIEYITSSPVIIMIIEGDNAIKKMRTLAGSAKKPELGTIREKYGIHDYKNLIHTSDSYENYKIEVERFFKSIECY